MSATYDPAQEKAKDRVRFLIRDVKDTFMLQDEEIEAILALEANEYLAAARCGDAILGNDRGITRIAVDRVAVTKGLLGGGEAYAELIKALRVEGIRLKLISNTGAALFGAL